MFAFIFIFLGGRSGEANGTPFQYSCLENPMDRGAWCPAVRGVTKSWIRLNDFTFTFHFHALEKEMATLSSVLAWRIPGMGKPGGLPSMWSQRVRHDWNDLAAAAAGDRSKKILLCFLSRSVLPMFSSKNFKLPSLIFRSLIYFEFIFVYGVREW